MCKSTESPINQQNMRQECTCAARIRKKRSIPHFQPDKMSGKIATFGIKIKAVDTVNLNLHM